jgi:hypothetical protein
VEEAVVGDLVPTEDKSSNVSEELKLNSYFDCIIFDLDDTLAPVNLALQQAMDALIDYIDAHMPLSAPTVKAKLRDCMKRQ